MFLIILYVLYLFYYQENSYARMHVLVLIDTIFFGLIFLSCIFLCNNLTFSLKYFFLWFLVFLSSIVNMSLLSSSLYKVEEKEEI